MKAKLIKEGSEKGGTRERILSTALDLYNQLGTSAVTTNHIAAGAGLSVGNLYYHFKNREEIIRALFDLNMEATKEAFRIGPETQISLTLLEQMVVSNYEILWRYRFFYRELIVLLNRDLVLADTFRAHRGYGFSSFERLLGAFSQMGVLKPLASDEARTRLAMTVWLVSEFFIQFLESHTSEFPVDFVAQGSGLLRQVLEPYLAEGVSFE